MARIWWKATSNWWMSMATRSTRARVGHGSRSAGVAPRRASPSVTAPTARSGSRPPKPPWPRRRSKPSAPASVGGRPTLPLAPEVRPGEVDDLVAPAAEHRLEHEDAEASHLLEADRRWHGEFPSVHRHVDERGSVVREGLGDHRLNLLRPLRGEPQEPGSLGHLREIGVVEVRSEVEEPCRLHLQLHEGQGVVSEHDDLHRELQLPEREQIAHEHRKAAIAT